MGIRPGSCRSLPAWWLPLGALLLALAGCEPPGQIVEVIIEAADPTLRLSLEVEVALLPPGAANPIAVPGERVLRRLDRFFLRLPLHQRGELSVRVSGLDRQGCRVSAGQGQLSLAPDAMSFQRLPVTLHATARGCLLEVLRFGPEDGRVFSSNLPGIECPERCEASFINGQELVLSAQGTPAGTFFTGWSGACTGLGPCPLRIGSGTVQVIAHFAPRQICTEAGWCWEQPRPQGNLLHRLWGSAADDLWAVGGAGTVLHYAGTAWTPVRSGVRNRLFGVWGTAPDDVWVVGNEGHLLHWDGRSFKKMESGTSAALFSIHGVKAGPAQVSRDNPVHLWAVGGEGTMLRWQWDGATLAPLGNGLLLPLAGWLVKDIWGSAPEDLWAVASGPGLASGAILRFDGSSWKQVQETQDFLWSVWGSGRDDVWFVGGNPRSKTGSVLRFDGRSVKHLMSGQPGYLLGVSGSGPDDIWAVGEFGTTYRFRQDGSAQAFSANTRLGLSASWGASREERWAVGDGGIMMRWNGAFWSPASSSRSPETLTTIGGTGADDLWAAGPGTILRSSGRGWHAFTLRGMDSIIWMSVLPIRRAEAWLTGIATSGILVRIREGREEADQVFPLPELFPLKAWSGSEARERDLWLVGWDIPLSGPHPSSSLVHLVWQDATRTFSTNRYRFSCTLWSMGGSGPRDLWAVGRKLNDEGQVRPCILHGDGTTFTDLRLPLEEDLRDVWASGPNDVWMAGGKEFSLEDAVERGVLVHYDGHFFHAARVNRFLRGLWGRGPGDLWAVGSGGTVYRHHGPLWRPEDTGAASDLFGVWGTPDGGHLYAVGENGTLLLKRR